MSLYEGSGSLTAAGYAGGEEGVICRGWVTVALIGATTLDVTWQFRGPSGVWEDIYAGSDNVTIQTYTANHMANFFFGGDVRIRGNATTLTGTGRWQIIGNPNNRV